MKHLNIIRTDRSKILLSLMIFVALSAGLFTAVPGRANASSVEPPTVATPGETLPQETPSKGNRNFIYYDSATGQIVAKTSAPQSPAQTSWEQSGYIRHEVTKDEFKSLSRDHYAILTDGSPTSFAPRLNPVQAEIEIVDMSRSAIEDRLENDQWSRADVAAYLKILGGF